MYGIGNLILCSTVTVVAKLIQVVNYKTSHEKVEDSWFGAVPRKTH